MSDATDLYYALRAPRTPRPRIVRRHDATAISDTIYCSVAWVAGSIGVLVPLAILGYLAWHGLSALTPEFLFDPPRGSSLDGKGGIWPAIKGSLALVCLGLVLALGLGIGGANLPRCEAVASRVALLGGGSVALILGAAIGATQLLR